MAVPLDPDPKNFEMDEPRSLQFCREVTSQKIFDRCPGFLQNLDQRHNGALKTVFLEYGKNFGIYEPKGQKFRRGKTSKNISQYRFFQNLDQGPDEVLKTVFLKYG